MISFILNNITVETNEPSGMALLDFIRYNCHLTGTKTGCNEGDCGACTVLIGDLVNKNELSYLSYTSCLTPLGKVQGKHVVTVEGLNFEEPPGANGAGTLNPIQQAMYEHSATQCGFCTPGFVVSFAGFCLSNKPPSYENAIAAIDGNICRCTGYKSLERAAAQITDLLRDKRGKGIEYLTGNNILPGYFSSIEEKLAVLKSGLNGEMKNTQNVLVAGGTDLYVQKHNQLKDTAVRFLEEKLDRPRVFQQDGKCYLSAEATASDLLESTVMQQNFPKLEKFLKLVSSTQIRNMATVAGNFVNASPIGDFTIFFLALDARLMLKGEHATREIRLREFYKGYKQLNLLPGEHMEEIWFHLPSPAAFFNFEKVSKRTNLDIASVNSAIYIKVENEKMSTIGLSAGGVAPVPMYLEKTSAFLMGKTIDSNTVAEALNIVQKEVSPISDARGSEAYKRLLLNQLIKAHFIELFPGLVNQF